MNLMDYSLLIGVRREKFEVVEESLRKSTMSNSYVKESMSKKSQSCTFADSSVRASSDADKYSVIEKRNVDEENSNSQSLSSMGTGARFEGSTSNQSTNAQDLPESIQVDMFGRDPDGGMHAKLVEGPGTYYIGLIDVLQEWNYKKKLERIFKIYIRGENRDGLSAISPIKYANRFLQRAVLDVFDGLDESEKMLSRQISVNSVATNQVMLGLKNNLNGVGSDSLMQRPDSLSASIHSEATVGEEGIKYVRRIDSAREQ